MITAKNVSKEIFVSLNSHGFILDQKNTIFTSICKLLGIRPQCNDWAFFCTACTKFQIGTNDHFLIWSLVAIRFTEHYFFKYSFNNAGVLPKIP